MRRPSPLPRLALSGLAVALLLLAGCSGGVGARPRYPAGPLTIATGGSEGVYYSYATGYARLLRKELPDLDLRIVTTAGSVDNLQRLASGRAQLGFATADTAFQAMGTPGLSATPSPAPATATPSPPATNLRAIARIYDEYIHLVVPSGAKIHALRDLRGMRVSTGQRGSSTELVAGRLLGAVGLDADRDLRRTRVGINQSLTMLRDGSIDAFFWSGGLPTNGIRTLAKARKIRLVPLGDYVNALRKAYGTYYRRAVIPASTYEGVPQTVTIGVPNYLIVSAELDDGLVYEFTRVLFERRAELARDVESGKRLDPRSAISTLPIRLHPGAERYYRDHKP